MKTSPPTAFALIVLFLMAIYAPTRTEAVCDSTATPTAGDVTTMSIDEIACDPTYAATFGRLCALLKRTGLNETLSRNSTTDFFVFAPTNGAFVNARATAGVTTPQITKTLQYHVSNNSTDVVCGERKVSVLTHNGMTKSSITRCATDGRKLGQTGNTRTPRPLSPLPDFVSPTLGSETAITACNGLIRAIDQVLGFGPVIYNYGNMAPCSFYSKSCKGAKSAKSRYPRIQGNEQNVNGLNFDSISLVNTKAKKSSKAWGGWQQRQRQQQLNNQQAASPSLQYLYDRHFVRNYPPKNPKYGKYHGKSAKKYKYGKRRLRGSRQEPLELALEDEQDVVYSPYEPEQVEYQEGHDYYQ
uniref:FAS1 domain-containing protein n=1 Tax=Pseudo-nitzschia australis TaxID=44445 RepID=A0A7S4EQN5_9STRA|mmetsp:Transcript_17201/g.37628  ORF Transcript_17201/g.37628 Transcript_17201/m.37628 type:complete len:356 (+) Transcript_17201:66-1133(+)|eukprot:CAMPEP_0168181124 /NCGR_PEP_ID=MMETSP0139_2-20121125/11012_1 /TAXON_ID=44445 /ORGANISM="Pseudo-nitzschia australis, Strain 10249 10 AB" /LENGTH=355 /DNA_ID=CAMNT_0008101605 /DNA_START=56 /DNA_END=1123 /DNA_ORIENTATION=+